jgi:cation:H+ antiporter
MLFSLLLCLIGFIILSYAADKMVEGASNLALNLGVSKTVVGLTIVAAGTSLPELVVSLSASLKGNAALSLGNVVGSNIMNAALILGIASLIHPIACGKEIVRRETPIMIGTALALWYVAHTGSCITPAEGVALFSLLVAYTGLSYYWSKKETAIAAEIAEKTDTVAGEEEPGEQPTTLTNVVYIIAGMVGLVIGSETLVRGAIDIDNTFGVSDEIIGLTLIAIGTSLPELATSVVAARKGQSEISLGNVVGSNIFNILAIVGCASIASHFNTDPAAQIMQVSTEMLGLHIPLMVVVSLGVLPIMSTGMRIVRAEGAFLVIVYIAYTIMLFQTTAPAMPAMDTPAAITASSTAVISNPAESASAAVSIPEPAAAMPATAATASETALPASVPVEVNASETPDFETIIMPEDDAATAGQ